MLLREKVMIALILAACWLGFTDAWDFNKLIILIFPALIYFWAKEILKAFASLKEEQEPKN